MVSRHATCSVRNRKCETFPRERMMDHKSCVVGPGSYSPNGSQPLHMNLLLHRIRRIKMNKLKTDLSSRMNHTTRRILLIACATALAVGFMVSLPQPAHAQNI